MRPSSALFLLLTCFLGLLFESVIGSKFAYEMLKAAEKGETDKVMEMINEKGVFITTKNNYGVRYECFAYTFQ